MSWGSPATLRTIRENLEIISKKQVIQLECGIWDNDIWTNDKTCWVTGRCTCKSTSHQSGWQNPKEEINWNPRSTWEREIVSHHLYDALPEQQRLHRFRMKMSQDKVSWQEPPNLSQISVDDWLSQSPPSTSHCQCPKPRQGNKQPHIPRDRANRNIPTDTFIWS